VRSRRCRYEQHEQAGCRHDRQSAAAINGYSQTLAGTAGAGRIPSTTAKGIADRPTGTSTGSGIDSPLTESSRTNYGTTYVTTSDGLFSIAFTAVKQLTMKDASNRTVIFNYQEPTA
jgi:hypothetical protein